MYTMVNGSTKLTQEQQKILKDVRSTSELQQPTSQKGGSFDFFQKIRNNQLASIRARLVASGKFTPEQANELFPPDTRKPLPRSTRQVKRALAERERPRPSAKPKPTPTTREEFQRSLFERQDVLRQERAKEAFRQEIVSDLEQRQRARQGVSLSSQLVAPFTPAEAPATTLEQRRIQQRTGEVQPAQAPRIRVERLTRSVRQRQQKLRGKKGVLAESEKFALGAAEFGLSSAKLLRETFINPRRAAIETFSGAKEISRRVVTGEGFPEVGTSLRTETARTTGKFAGFLLTAKGLGAGVTQVRKGVRAATKPVKVTKVGIQTQTVTKDGKKIIGSPQVSFKAQVGKQKFTGRGAGAATLTDDKLLAGVIKLEVQKGKTGSVFRTATPFKSRVLTTGETGTGITISKTITPQGKTLRQAITPFRFKEVVGGELPRTVVKSGVITGKKTRFTPQIGQVTVTKATARIDDTLFATTLQKGVGTKQIRQIFRRQRLGKRGELILQPRPNPTPGPSGLGGSIFGSEFQSAIRSSVRLADLAGLKPTRAIPIRDIRRRQIPSRQITEPEVETFRQRQDPIRDVAPRTDTRVEQRPAFRPIQTTRPISRVSDDVGQRSLTDVVPRVIEEVKATPVSVTSPIQVPTTRSVLSPTPFPTPIVPVVPRPPRLPSRKKKVVKKKPSKEEGFNLEVREGEKRGDKYKVVSRNLPKNRALKRGRDIVDNFVEASFRVVPSGFKTKQKDISKPSLAKFRKPKGKTKLSKNTFVEKRKFRIDTRGEKAGLAFFKRIKR